MDISSLLNVSSNAVSQAATKASTSSGVQGDESFGSLFQSALGNLNETNSLLNESEEKVKFALGITDNTHDMAIAAAKASTAVNYTTALRDRFLEAYREIIQIQI